MRRIPVFTGPCEVIIAFSITLLIRTRDEEGNLFAKVKKKKPRVKATSARDPVTKPKSLESCSLNKPKIKKVCQAITITLSTTLIHTEA
jgi:hypothetical protein